MTSPSARFTGDQGYADRMGAINDRLAAIERNIGNGLSGAIVPVGGAIPFWGTTPPTTWLLCYGQLVDIDDYPVLFDEIGHAGNAGVDPGGSQFRIPDLRGRAPFGVDDMGGTDAGRLSVANTLGLTGGVEMVTLTSTELPAHTHSINHDHGSVSSGSTSHSHTASSSATSHNHSASSATTSHSHSVSLTTGTESADHTHSGTTGGISAGHVHTGLGGEQNAVRYPGSTEGLSTGYNSNGVTFQTSTSGENANHTHSITTGGRSATHTHSVSGSTSTESSHTHAITVNSESSHTHGITVNSESSHTHTVDLPNFTGTSGSAGSGTAFTVMSPFILCNWIIRAE